MTWHGMNEIIDLWNFPNRCSSPNPPRRPNPRRSRFSVARGGGTAVLGSGLRHRDLASKDRRLRRVKRIPGRTDVLPERIWSV